MVESPTAAIYKPVTSEDPDAPLDKKTGTTEPDLILVKQKPITAKLCTAIKHLRERGGRLAYFRGISIFVVYNFVLIRLAELLARFTPVPLVVTTIVSSVLLARLRTAWVHIVISEPSRKYWFQRLPSWKSWKKVALPTAILAICQQITIALPAGLWVAFGLARFDDFQQVADMSDSERKLALVKAFAVVLLAIFCGVAIVIPAQVTLTRVQASLISEEDEPIVPFDRSFGGRVAPEIVGGSGVVGILDAWKTFDLNSRVKLLKLYAKATLVQVAVAFMMMVVIVAQLHFIMGKEFQKYIMAIRASINH
jgi:hypothetical protein